MAMSELPALTASATAPATPAQPGAKKRRNEDEMMVDLSQPTRQGGKYSELMMKMLLNNTQRIRTLEGCLLETYKVPANHPMIKGMSEEASRYSAQTQELGRGHNLGPPSKYVWRSMLRWITTNAAQAAPEKAKIDEYMNAWNECNQNRNPSFSIQMRHCKVAKAYDKEFKKLTLCIDLGPLADAVRTSLLQAKFVPFEGSAPPGVMERQLQARLK